MRLWTRSLTVAAIGFAVASCATAAPASERWRSLFDGKTLAGWTPKIAGYPLGVNFGDTFRVRDGAIVVDYDKYENRFGNRFGHLFFQTALRGAYRLRLEYRFLEGGLPDAPPWAVVNSGVMIFAQDPKTMALAANFPVSVEAQLLGPVPGQTRFTGNMCSPGTNIVMDGQLVTTHCILSKTPAPPIGQWVRFEVEVARDGTVTEKVNGRPTLVYSGVQLDPAGVQGDSRPLISAAGGKLMLDGGMIALQAESTPIEFRKIELLRLD